MKVLNSVIFIIYNIYIFIFNNRGSQNVAREKRRPLGGRTENYKQNNVFVCVGIFINKIITIIYFVHF